METISPVYARLVLREMERCERDTSALFDGSSLDRDRLLKGGDIAVSDFLRILEVGQRSLPNSQLGLMLGRYMRVFAMGPLGSGMAVAPTLRDGLQLMESYTRLHTSYVDLEASSTLTGLTVRLSYRHDTGRLERFHSETAMLLMQQYVEELTGQRLEDAHYQMSCSAPQNMNDYEQAFHSRISFNCPQNQADIPRRWLDLPSPYFHPDSWREVQQSLSRQLKALGDRDTQSYTRHVQALLRASEPPLPELATVASNLLVSERTLNRRLQAENNSFRQLKSVALANWACLYLQQTDHSVESVAATLGYQDTANFRRAFRKSTGLSPQQYRKTNART